MKKPAIFERLSNSVKKKTRLAIESVSSTIEEEAKKIVENTSPTVQEEARKVAEAVKPDILGYMFKVAAIGITLFCIFPTKRTDPRIFYLSCNEVNITYNMKGD